MKIPSRSLVLVVLAVIGSTFVFLLGAHYGGGRQALAIEARLDALEHAHKALQDTYLEGTQSSRRQLAQSLGYRQMPTHSGAPGPAGGAAGAAAAASAPPDGPRAVADAYQEMRESFAAEPINPAWANNVQLNIRDVFQGLSQQGLEIPAIRQVECRRQSCLITLELDASGESDTWMEMFLTEIAGDLPLTRSLRIPSPDGARTTLYIHAGRKIPPPRG